MIERPPIDTVLRSRALNGECPTWCDRTQRLFWVDIREPALHRFDPVSGHDDAWEMPSWIGCLALCDAGVAVALRTGLFLLDLEAGVLAPLAHSPFDCRRFIFNDGGADPRGRFLAGTMHVPLKPDAGRSGADASPLWRYDGSGAWSAITPPAKTSNALAFSPDGRTMYHADTAQKTIWAWDYDIETGTPRDRRVFASVEVEDGSGGPDGAATDCDGFVWCALLANGCLLRFDPEGKVERRVAMPVKYPTMPAFGGPDLRTIFVTSANWPLSPAERERNTDEGNLFAFEAPVPGLPTRRCNLGRPS